MALLSNDARTRIQCDRVRSKYSNKLPKTYENIINLVNNRGSNENVWRSFKYKAQVYHSLIDRLGLAKELKGHCGCVNCIEFNENGNLLLSGSDDFNIILWDVNKKIKLKSISTYHRGNIFSVKFIPETADIIASGAGDCHLEVREIQSNELLQVCRCHTERIKRIATVPGDPTILFTGSEDGTVLQHDTRKKHNCSDHPNNVLINLKSYVTRPAEIKCVTVHPLRTELLAVGASDPYVRVYDRRMIKLTNNYNPPERLSNQDTNLTSDESDLFDLSDSAESSSNLTRGCVQYFVPGHLPSKMQHYYKRYRSLATTYLSYSSDGRHILANLGGDHVYLFDTYEENVPNVFHLPSRLTNERHETDTRQYSYRSKSSKISLNHISASSLPVQSEVLKQQASIHMFKKNYTSAIQIYNSLLQKHQKSDLFSARAEALLRRKWDGDIYAGLRDCNAAIDLDSTNLEARLRLVTCLDALGLTEETKYNIEEVQKQFPNISSDMFELSSASKQPSVSDSDRDEENRQPAPLVCSQEQDRRDQAKDYEKVFNGHCNTTTDIKEAVFIGKDGQYIAAGSDDGNLFIWDRHTTNLVKVLKADGSIVNCVQSHPNICMLATSGIESVIKLWTPLVESEESNSTEQARIHKISQDNQQRMSTDPMEMMILQMGDIAQMNDFVEGWVQVNEAGNTDSQRQHRMQCTSS